MKLMTYAFPLVSFLIAIAAIVTPLGLYEEDEPSTNPVVGDFASVRDAGPFAAGTSSRDGKSFSRECRFGNCPGPCPWMEGSVVMTVDSTSTNCETSGTTNTTVPHQVHDIFSSGTRYSRTTVSNFFDIQWRQLTTRFSRDYDDGNPYSVGVFRQLDSFALDDQVRAIEGLVVDGSHGSIGFRNHTIPRGHETGVEWSEDLLFLEPESRCVDNNLTIDFSVTTSRDAGFTIDVTDFVLTDRGGFFNFNKTSPREDQRNGENKPDLLTRAYQAAWATTGLSMWYMNITMPANETEDGENWSDIKSEKGKTFTLSSDSLVPGSWKSLEVSTLGSHLTPPFAFNASRLGGDEYPNPWGVLASDFTEVGECATLPDFAHVLIAL